jgi:hypothetical protein
LTRKEERKKAEQGDMVAQANMGIWYEDHRDNAQAIYWYKKAIEKRAGVPQAYAQRKAERNLGRLLTLEAERKKAEQGDVTSQFNLGRRYETGDDVDLDKKQAVFWYRKALRKRAAQNEDQAHIQRHIQRKAQRHLDALYEKEGQEWAQNLAQAMPAPPDAPIPPDIQPESDVSLDLPLIDWSKLPEPPRGL